MLNIGILGGGIGCLPLAAEKICRITAIVVDQNVRGTGTGTQLIEFAKSLCKKRGCAKLEVTTSLAR